MRNAARAGGVTRTKEELTMRIHYTTTPPPHTPPPRHGVQLRLSLPWTAEEYRNPACCFQVRAEVHP